MVSPVDNSFYADPQAINGLKREAKTQSPEALRETARQFESLFTQMMLKSMRDATPKDPLFGSDQQDFYQDMFDSQMANQMSKGKGLGLADVLVRQLMQAGVSPEVAGKAAAAGQKAADAASSDSAAASVGAATTGKADSATRQDFIDSIKPAAERAAATLGVDANTLIAHAALETGWGRSLPRGTDGSSSNNLFGIKAGDSWKGAVASTRTHEVESGTTVTRVADFRAYGSAEECMQDYAKVIGQNPRYAAAMNTGGDAASFAQALQRGGYATDPNYASKLTALARELKSHASVPITKPDAA